LHRNRVCFDTSTIFMRITAEIWGIVRKTTCVRFAVRNFTQTSIWRSTQDHIRARNLLVVVCAGKNFLRQVQVRFVNFSPIFNVIFSLIQMSGLRMHAYIHTGEKPFRCKIPNCGKSFNQYGHVREHMLTHSDKKAWTCHICLHSFRVKGNLTAHLMIHTNKHPYTCKVEKCGKRFIQSTKLRQHYEKNHGGTQIIS
jgi:hypothetical protein